MKQLKTRGRVNTYRELVSLLIRFIPALTDSKTKLLSRFGTGENVEASDDAEEFASALEEMGPAFVKVGQLLSTRSDLLPQEWTLALERLQDDVAPVPFEEIASIIENDLGVSPTKLFRSINEVPFAVGSIGQVHRATLRDSQDEVVVKVRRPGIEQKMRVDLDVICEVADFLEKHTRFGADYDVGIMMKQFQRTILAELDFTRELKNLERIRDAVSETDRLIAPQGYENLSSRQVLTMEYIAGRKLTDLSGVVLTEVDGDGLVSGLFECYLDQILVDGFFHADPHPGNVLLTADHQLALIDLGMVGYVPKDLQESLLRLLSAVAEGDADAAAEVALSMGSPKEGFDEDLFRAEMRRIAEDREGEAVEELKMGALIIRITQACGRNQLRIPDSIFVIGKMMLNIDRVGKILDPDFDPDDCIRRNVHQIATRKIREDLSAGAFWRYLGDLKNLIQDTPSHIHDILEKVARNEIRVKVDTIDEEKLLKGFHRVANRITVGLILSALIIGASMLMRIESRFTLFGYPGLAISLFLIAAFGGLVLVGRILFTSEKR
ncbi:MAG: AarF/UbiB family protein [Verrucomicrobiota bacterium]